jgi:hypothetical protein
MLEAHNARTQSMNRLKMVTEEQLAPIEKAVNDAINKGNFMVVIPKGVNDDIKMKLESLGYKVSLNIAYDQGSYSSTTISWK